MHPLRKTKNCDPHWVLNVAVEKEMEKNIQITLTGFELDETWAEGMLASHHVRSGYQGQHQVR